MNLSGAAFLRRVLLPLLFLGASCSSYLPFTDRTADRYDLRLRDLRLIQFYTSDEFTLRRDTSDASAQITRGGTIRYFNGRRIEELRVRRHTPGAALDRGDRGLSVSFVPGDDRNVLLFAPLGEVRWDDPEYSRGDEPRSGRFAAPPPASSSSPPARPFPGQRGEHYFLDGDEEHPISYDGKQWTVHFDRRPYLLIRSRDIQEKDTQVRTLPGRTIGN